jgi:hypothetical protein
VIMERSALPALLLTLLLGLLMQAMLAGARYATEQGEWLYRSLYLIALAFNLGAVRRVNPPSLRSACVLLAPMVLTLVCTWLVVEDKSHAAVMLLVLPIAHALVAGYFCVAVPQALRH